MQTQFDVARVLEAAERTRTRLWAVCYRMTGNRTEADELCQEAIARAIERADQSESDDPTGWLLRLTTRLCLDRLRHLRIERRVAELVDPLDLAELPHGEPGADPEQTAILREDVRFAIVVALQQLTPKQRSAVILRDICGCSLAALAETLETTENAAKVLLYRARAALAEARRHASIDVPVDIRVVEHFARAIAEGDIERLTELLAEDVWGVVDGGGVVQTAKKPTFGRRAVSRQWQNGKRRLGQPVTTEIRRINGEGAIVVRLLALPDVVVAIVHLESRDERVVALRVNRDPSRIAYLGVPLQ